jgi:hypothetical protein
MPYSAFNRVELHTKEVLVDFENSRHNHGDGEILFHDHIIQVEGLLNVLPIVVAVVPEVKVSVEGEACLLMFLLLHVKEDGQFLLADRSQLALQVIKELNAHILDSLYRQRWCKVITVLIPLPVLIIFTSVI